MNPSAENIYISITCRLSSILDASSVYFNLDVFSSNFRGPLFTHYNIATSYKGFGMTIENAHLAAYFKGNTSPDIKLARLESNHLHYVGASYDHKNKIASLWMGKRTSSQAKKH